METLSDSELKKQNETKIVTGAAIALFGGLMLLIGLFLPWITSNILSVSGYQKIADESYIIILLGGISVLLGLIAALTKKNYWIAYLVFGLASAAYLLFVFDKLKRAVNEVDIKFDAHLGPGFWICCLGAVFIIVSTFISQEKVKKEEPEEEGVEMFKDSSLGD
jgi:nitrate reductase gamma subunit